MPRGLPGLEEDALANYHFTVEVDGKEIAQFQELSGLNSECDVIDFKFNRADGKPGIHRLPGNRKPPTLTLKRGKDSSMELWQWHQDVFEGKVKDARKNGSIIFQDYVHGEVSRYNFNNGWPSKVSVSTAKAGANELLVEEVTIVADELFRVK